MANKNSKETKETNNLDEGRVMTKYDRKMQKRREDEIQRKKRKMAVRGTGIVVILACIVAVAFLIYAKVAESISYIKIDDKSISQSEFEYYYNQAVSNYSYAIDTSRPLDEQQCLLDTSMTWKDYFEKTATEEIVNVKALLKDAEKNNFKGNVDREYEIRTKSYAQAAKANNMSEEEYYKNTFGDAKEDIEEYMKEAILADQWYLNLSNKQEISDEEIEEYYQKNKDNYDNITYYISTVSAEGVTVGSSSDAEITTAMALAKTKAETQLNSIETSGEQKESIDQSSMSQTLHDWLFSEERVENETAVVEDSTSAVCYALKFCKRTRNEKPTSNFYLIQTSEKDADEILKEWESGEKTENSFIGLVDKYTENITMEDGFYENFSESDMAQVEELSEWLFEDGRKEGDTVVKKISDEIQYVVYYKGEGDPTYKAQIHASLVNTAVQTYVKSLTDPIKVADPNGVLKYLEQAGN